jgi:hypothetical protein
MISTGTQCLIRNSENRKALKTESFFMEVVCTPKLVFGPNMPPCDTHAGVLRPGARYKAWSCTQLVASVVYPLLQDPQARCNVPLLHVYVQVYRLVWARLCLKFYWMFYLEIKSTLVILWSIVIPIKINNAMNNIYQLVLIRCAILLLSFWPLIPRDYHSEIRKIPISETCLVPRVSDKRLCTCTE